MPRTARLFLAGRPLGQKHSGMSCPVFDGHNDLLLRLQTAGDLNGTAFFRERGEWHLDLPRARKGGLGGGLFAVFVPKSVIELQQAQKPVPPHAFALASALEQISIFREMCSRSAGTVKHVRTSGEVARCLADGVFAASLHMEGAEPVAEDLSNLGMFHEAGVRSIGLVWSRANAFGHGVPFQCPGDPDTGPGLTEAGCELVRACNQLGILLDVSHLNERGFRDVARLTNAPLVATHSNVHALSPTARNLKDRQFDAIRDSGGIVGVCFGVTDLRPDGARDANTPVSLVADHVDHMVERMGIEHVGLGSDFDGTTVPLEIGDATGIPRLFDCLRARGYDDEALKKIMHGNWLRVLSQTWQE
jgi:membrane dipeptidase